MLSFLCIVSFFFHLKYKRTTRPHVYLNRKWLYWILWKFSNSNVKSLLLKQEKTFKCHDNWSNQWQWLLDLLDCKHTLKNTKLWLQTFHLDFYKIMTPINKLIILQRLKAAYIVTYPSPLVRVIPIYKYDAKKKKHNKKVILCKCTQISDVNIK